MPPERGRYPRHGSGHSLSESFMASPVVIIIIIIVVVVVVALLMLLLWLLLKPG